MTPTTKSAFLRELRRELAARWVAPGRILEETGDHLDDAILQRRKVGADEAAAEAAAIEAFGSPAMIAEGFASDRQRVPYRIILGVALACGVAIAYVDSRPTWDDSGVSALAMLATAALCGVLAPRRAWLWALAVGLWIPVYAFMRAPSLGELAMVVVLLFPLAGAYLGVGVRKLLKSLSPEPAQ